MVRNVSRTLATLALAVGVVVATPTVAQAQFGGLVNKVKSKVAPRPEISVDAPRFDATTVELTSERIDAVIRGLNASVNVVNGTSGNGVKALSARVASANAELSALEEKHPAEKQQYRNSVNKITDCRSDAFDKIHQAQTAQMQGKMMSDPAFRARYMASARDMQDAVMRQDTAAVRKLQERMLNTLMPTSRADSQSVDKKCGVVPAPPAFLAREKQLSDEVEKWDSEIQDMLQKAGPAGAQASGLTVPQFATAQERIRYFLDRAKNGVAQRGFTAPELTVLRAHEAELAKLQAQLDGSRG